MMALPFLFVQDFFRLLCTGLHSSIDDPKGLVQKIVAILDDPEEAKDMGKNGRQYFLEHFERKMVTSVDSGPNLPPIPV